MIERESERDDAKDEVWFKISMHLPNTPIPQSVHGSNILSKVGRMSFLLCDAFIHKDNVVNSNEIFSCPRARQLNHAWKNLQFRSGCIWPSKFTIVPRLCATCLCQAVILIVRTINQS